MNRLCVLTLLALAAIPCGTEARRLTITPTNPVALEYVHVQSNIRNCERFLFVAPAADGFTVHFDQGTESQQFTCDEVLVFNFTLGAFPPGTYNVRTVISSPDMPTIVGPETNTFVVSAGPASTVPGADRPYTDLSGVWTTPAEPFTGFAFIHSPYGITGLWYDYSGAQATWSMLLLAGRSGPIVRAVPTGTGSSRTITLTPVGTATLSTDMGERNWRLRGTIDERTFDFPIERFRWSHAGWPGRAPDAP